MQIAICEDDDAMLAETKKLIENWSEARGTQVDIKCFPNAEAFIMAWPENSFDIAFLDIEMKLMTGLELAYLIRKSDKNMLIVFQTQHTHYALLGYEVDAFHYLVKPPSLSKLSSILDSAYVFWKSSNDDFILVSDGVGRIKLTYGDVFYILKKGHIAEIHTTNSSFEIRKTIEQITNEIPDYFIRCHRSYIVNLLKVDCMYRDSLLLSNGMTLPISRNNSKSVNDMFIRLFKGR